MKTKKLSDVLLSIIMIAIFILICKYINNLSRSLLEEIHIQSVSPDKKWKIVITKQDHGLTGVDIFIKIIPQDSSKERAKFIIKQLDHIDNRRTFKKNSFLIKWLSNKKFIMASRSGSFGKDSYVVRLDNSWSIIEKMLYQDD